MSSLPATEPQPVLRAWWLPALAACGYLFTAQFAPPVGALGFPLDDAWIHLQFAARLAAGDGLAYNPGVWVTGSTAPLWSALVAVVSTVAPGAAVLGVQLLGVVFLLIAADAAGRLAHALGLGPGSVWLTRVLVASSYWLVWSALSGMEITLFAALSLWGLVLHVRARTDDASDDPRALAALGLFAVAGLARPEGYLLLALAFADHVLAPGVRATLAGRLTRALEAGALVAVVLLPTLLFYRAIGGSWLPTTFAVKGSSPSSILPDGRYLRVVADIFFRSQPVLLLATGAGIARALSQATMARRALLPAAWLVGLPMVYALLTPSDGPPAVGNFGRYYLPLVPLVVVLGLYGLQPSIARLARRPAWLRLLAVALLAAPQLLALVSSRAHYARTVANVQDSDVAAARWLAPRLDPRALLAVQDIGALKYGLPNRLIDLAGIVTPDIVPILRGTPDDSTYWEQRLLTFLGQQRPDYLIVFRNAYPMLTRPAPGFRVVTSFTVERNLAMAGSELVILSTPWTRYPLGTPDPTTPRKDSSS